jgi:hypothetical protein
MDLMDFRTEWHSICDKWADKGYDSLTDLEKVWFNAESLLCEVQNGGFAAVYYNSTADYMDDILIALEKLGLKRFINIVKKANDLFPNGKPPKDMDDRNKIINTWSEKEDRILGACDDEFFLYDKIYEEKLVEFIQNSGLLEQ